MFGPARAAISLTYDDGMSQHLDHAAPDLEAHGLRGTFYVPTAGGEGSTWHTRPGDWIAVAKRGHEVGNHTRLHPCRGWAGNNLKEYTLERICAELTLAQSELDDRVGRETRSFAYACCNTTVGPDDNQTSYVDFTETLFPASRMGGDQFADPAAVDFRLVPSFIMTEKYPIARMIELLDEAIEKQKWMVLTFHGVGGGHINYDRADHQTLCKAIADRAGKLRCGTFVEIAIGIRTATNRPWRR